MRRAGRYPLNQCKLGAKLHYLGEGTIYKSSSLASVGAETIASISLSNACTSASDIKISGVDNDRFSNSYLLVRGLPRCENDVINPTYQILIPHKCTSYEKQGLLDFVMGVGTNAIIS